MIALGKSRLTVWADTIGIPNLALAEHDLSLTHALAGIYASPKLKPAIRKLVYYYFFRAGKIFSWKGLRANLEEKLADKRFGDDIKPFLRPDVSFDATAAIREFPEAFAHFGEPDARDEEFLALAKGLIGRTTSAKKLAKTAHVVHPLKALMHPISITAEASAMTVEDIRAERGHEKENHRDA